MTLKESAEIALNYREFLDLNCANDCPVMRAAWEEFGKNKEYTPNGAMRKLVHRAGAAIDKKIINHLSTKEE